MADKTFHSITLPGTDPARIPDFAQEFNTGTAYKVKDFCTYNGVLYVCKTAHAAGAWNASHFTATNLDTEFDKKLDIPASQASAPANPRVGDLWIDNDENSPIYNVDTQPTAGSSNAVSSNGVKTYVDGVDARKGNRSLFSGDYSASATYEINQLVMNGQQLYRCKTRIATPEAWTASHWQATSLNAELNRISDRDANTTMIAEVFGTSSFYKVGDYVIYSNASTDAALYRCIEDVNNTDSWDPDYWVQIALANEVSKIRKDFDSIIQPKDSIVAFDDTTQGVTTSIGYITSNGTFHAASSYYNLVIPIKQDGYCYPNIGSSFKHMAILSGKEMITDNLISYYSNDDNNIPTQNNPVIVRFGQYVAISSKNAVTTQLIFKYKEYDLNLNQMQEDVEILQEDVEILFNRDDYLEDLVEPNYITHKVTIDANTEGVVQSSGYTQSSGNFISNNSYKTLMIPITYNGICYPNVSTEFVHLAVYNASTISSANLIQGQYYSNADGNVPTSENPVTVHAGEYVALSSKNASTHQLKYNYILQEGYKLNSNLELTTTMKSEIWPDNPLNSNNINMNYLQIFRTMAVIGDSLASGRFNGGGEEGDEDATNGITDYSMSWIQMLARKSGVTAFNLSRGGMDTRGFFTYKRTDLPGEPYIRDLLNEPTWFAECYFIALGHNDKNHYSSTGVTLGTESDIGTDANTYYANYARIISAIQEYHPYSKIFCITMRDDQDMSVNPANLNFHNMNIAIRCMPNHFKNCYVLDMGYYYNAPAPSWGKTGAHGNAMGYLYYGEQISALCAAYIKSHTTDFKYVQLIGTTAESTIPDSQNANANS